MAHIKILIWACCLALSTSFAYGLGVNWGTQAAQTLHPRTIVQMLKDNKIDKVKLFDSDHWTVKYFAGTGIDVMLGIPNFELEKFSKDYDAVKSYVKNNVSTHLYDGGVIIKYVAVGNEPFLKAYNGSFLKTTFPALQNVQKALNEAGLGDKIKATIPQNADVYESSNNTGPSQGNFRPDIRDLMQKICRFFKENNAPFLVNIYPFLSLHENKNFPVEFAFFDGKSKPVKDNSIMYTNMFDANLDTLVMSLKKAQCEGVKIIVGEIGWPTDGDLYGNVSLAKKFYSGFFKKMATKKGTPLYPGYIEYYLFSLTDENQKSIAPGSFERHWGIFKYDGQPKFEMDFSGQGHEKMPVAAKGVKYLEKKWCIMNKKSEDTGKMPASVQYACTRADCTAMSYGGSCNKLDSDGNVSYAFNMFFQMNGQDVDTCNFDGLAKIVDHNASVGSCVFPLGIENAGVKIGLDAMLNILVGFFLFLALL